MNEVSLLREAAEGMDIGLRVNPSFSFDGGPGLPSKFGIDEEEALGAIRRGAFGGVRIAGLHVHLKSQELDAGKIAAYWSRVLGMAGRFRDALGKLDFVNLGSCIGLSGTGEAPHDLKDLSGAFEKAAEKLALQFIWGKSRVDRHRLRPRSRRDPSLSERVSYPFRGRRP